MVGVIIQARMGSTRLPGKVLKPILGNPLLYYSVFRSKLSKYVDKVIVATTENSPEIIRWCQNNQVDFFIGSETDVLDRYYQAAQAFDLITIVRVTSDNPFVDPRMIDLGVLYLQNTDCDYVSNQIQTRSWPYGLGIEVFTSKALKTCWKKASSSEDREHVTPFILQNPELFSLRELPRCGDLSYERITVDTLEDFENARSKLEKTIPQSGVGFSWKHIFEE